ncbi:MAG: zinc-dependent metalloprotease [Blastocatellia bacterium]
MKRRILPLTMIACLLAALPAGEVFHARAGQTETRTITGLTAGAKRIDGFIPLYWDQKTGRMWMEITRFDEEFLYQVSLPAGVGSNPIGLDRGQLGPGAVVRFERIGPRVLLVQPNYRYRALSSDAAERRAVSDSFARAVIWGFRIEATEGERVLVDATAFLLRDTHGVAEKLRTSRQGSFRFDESRSAFHLPQTKGFPQNTEIETIITLTGDDAGPLLRSVSPSAQALTVRQHHSLVELPRLEAQGYRPRLYDPRVSAMPLTFHDYASPFTEPIEKRWIRRHRLQKRDPAAAVSEPVRPIVYYVDNGVPEPIRSALVEGASWWAAAFEAAGFRNGFQVRVLPADADPMDIRYNMINWVHRSTRGWSYGASVIDPRTGEIIKGNVSLGSLRIRQDVLLGTGLIAPGASAAAGSGDPELECLAGASPEVDYLAAASIGDPATDSVAMSLARIRQLSAHEVGHTLGFSHNFAASSYGRASVMDYPAPLVEIKEGRLDLSQAYAVGMGSYDIFSVRYAYTQFPASADEAAELRQLVEQGVADGMLFIDDSDARDVGTAHPQASVWDNGSDAIAMLRHEMEVRRIGLRNFGLRNLPAGQPLSSLEAKLLPLYLHHRYQLAAAAKSLGGLQFTYAVRTDSGASPSPGRQIVAPARQREALRALLETISPAALVLPSSILDLIPPVATGFDGGATEYFGRRTEPAFDAIGAASIAAGLTFDALLAPARVERLVAFNAENPANPSLREVLAATISATWRTPSPSDSRQRAILLTTRSLLASRLIELASNENLSPIARAAITSSIRDLLAIVKSPGSDGAMRQLVRDEIERFLGRPDAPRQPSRRLPVPAGDPIGAR